MLRRSALGLAAGIALAAWHATAASAETTASLSDTTNDGNLAYVAPSGDTTGATDASNINIALTNYATVVLLPGDFYINAPIQFSPYTLSPSTAVNYGGQVLAGTCGATQSVSGSPGMNTTINATATFTSPTMPHLAAGQANPAGMIMCGLAVDSTGAEHPLVQCEVRDLWLATNGRGVDCITAWSTNSGFSVRRVGCTGQPQAVGYGLNIQNVSDLPGSAVGIVAEDMAIQFFSTGGIYAGAEDITLSNVHVQGALGPIGTAASNGITVTAGNARLMSCRSDENDGYGFMLNAAAGVSGIGSGITMVGCGSEGNLLGGTCVISKEASQTASPVQMTGCWFAGDGVYLGSSAAGPNYNPAVLAVGRVTVSMTDVVISTYTTKSPNFPAYCVQTMANGNGGAVPDLITVSGGMWEAGIQYVMETDKATHAQLRGTVGFIGPIPSGTSGTTPYELVHSSVFTNRLD